ncbi:unnamed protein product [Paramecium sonneborni]|uniref:Uncharacterized protein n=1 Tax=Paramecium sonneborni TaxID=65129 RepID=A0A8S1Q011_9CILI|nr:unnamed protein product [Paramecium sonneborni]
MTPIKDDKINIRRKYQYQLMRLIKLLISDVVIIPKIKNGIYKLILMDEQIYHQCIKKIIKQNKDITLDILIKMLDAQENQIKVPERIAPKVIKKTGMKVVIEYFFDIKNTKK